MFARILEVAMRQCLALAAVATLFACKTAGMQETNPERGAPSASTGQASQIDENAKRMVAQPCSRSTPWSESKASSRAIGSRPWESPARSVTRRSMTRSPPVLANGSTGGRIAISTSAQSFRSRPISLRSPSC